MRNGSGYRAAILALAMVLLGALWVSPRCVAAAGPDDPGYKLHAEEDEFHRPPLLAFRADNDRAGLTTLERARARRRPRRR